MNILKEIITFGYKNKKSELIKIFSIEDFKKDLKEILLTLPPWFVSHEP
jgi:hypothetical protein